MYTPEQIAEIARLRKQRKALLQNEQIGILDEDAFIECSLRLYQLTGHRGYLLGTY